MSRYLIGIDLGTTNCCVSSIDLLDPALAIHPFLIPQLNECGYIEPLPYLPSFCYLGNHQEQVDKEFHLPWCKSFNFAVGSFGKTRGVKVPTRLVQSAKSWLCHGAAKRKDPILPLEASDDEIKVSPVDATMRYLQHIREGWDHTKGKDAESQFDQQEIIITVPASFDEIARRLTVEAAHKAGYLSITLLEEPQAAFYSWISKNEGSWTSGMSVGETILVCDVGGGTTDFSMIKVIETSDGKGFERYAIGNHLLLGGDNIDAAIAHLIESKINQELTSSQWIQLKHKARDAKECLLSGESDHFNVVIQGSGSSVVKGSLSVEITRQEVEELILSGFFNEEDWMTASKIRPAKGLKSVGLPYEDEPSITRHLAQFIQRNGSEVPNYILFNGGTMKPKLFQNAILSSLHHWFPENAIKILETVSLDFAVARGAAYYGKVKKGLGTKIGGGSARGYYLALEDGGEKSLITLLPKGSEDGACYDPENVFYVKPNIPVSFELYTSHTRRNDHSGDLLKVNDEEFQSLPSIHTILQYGKQASNSEAIPVRLHIGLTAVGTLDLCLKSVLTPHIWNLQFQVRGAVDQARVRQDETYDVQFLNDAKGIVEDLFTEGSKILPKEIFEKLEKCLERQKSEWPPTILRGLWDAILKMAKKRKLTHQHEARWWNMAGFFLRPGFGYPLDEMRIKELWKVILEDFNKELHPDVAIQFWICCRRIAGGLNKGQQLQIGNKILQTILNKAGNIVIPNKKDLYPYHEKIRTLGSLELLEKKTKIQLANAITDRIKGGQAEDPEYWALGRFGGRSLIHGTIANVIDASYCVNWLDILLNHGNITSKFLVFAIEQLSRKTDVREVNIPQSISERVIRHYPNLMESLTRVSTLSQKENDVIFGEALPMGISLQSKKSFST